MRHLSFEPARPIDTDAMPWIPTGPGKSFRPLCLAADGWSELMRLEPGRAVAVHRRTGEVPPSTPIPSAQYLDRCWEHAVPPASQILSRTGGPGPQKGHSP